MMLQATKEEMQSTKGLGIKARTLLWMLLHRLPMNVKCAVIKQTEWIKPLWCGGQRLKHKYGEA